MTNTRRKKRRASRHKAAGRAFAYMVISFVLLIVASFSVSIGIVALAMSATMTGIGYIAAGLVAAGLLGAVRVYLR